MIIKNRAPRGKPIKKRHQAKAVVADATKWTMMTKKWLKLKPRSGLQNKAMF